jgi:hypothetical protein
VSLAQIIIGIGGRLISAVFVCGGLDGILGRERERGKEAEANNSILCILRFDNLTIFPSNRHRIV